MTRTRTLLLLAIVVALALLALWWARGRPAVVAPGNGAVAASEVVVRRGPLAAEVSATGSVAAARRAALSFPASGRVSELHVAVGDEVAEGAPLIAVDPTALTLQAEAAEAQAEAARAGVEEARGPAATGQIEAAQASVEAAQLALAVAEAERDALPEEERGESEEAARAEQARASLRSAEAQLRRAVEGATPEEIAVLEARTRAAEAQSALAREALANGTLVAPFAGTVVAVERQPGEIIGAGQMVVTLADMATLEIVAEVDEVDVGRVEAGQPVTVTLDSFPTQPLTGEVTRIAPTASGARGATSYATTIAFDPGALAVRLGMVADVVIQTALLDDALLLPLDAIRYAEAQPFVRLWRDGAWRDQPVTLGAQSEAEVAVVEGVSEGDRVQR